MGFLKAVSRVGKVVGHTALMPLDVTTDSLALVGDMMNGEAPQVRELNTVRRARRISEEVSEVMEETYRD